MTDLEKNQFNKQDDEIEEIDEVGLSNESKKVNRKSKKKLKPKERSMGYEIFTWVRDLSIVIIVVLLITTFVGEKIRVIGASMEPYVHDGDHFILDKLSYQFDEPNRFDIIAFPYDEDLNYIKRIVGLPGETIELKPADNNTYNIYIDGILLEETFGMEPIIRLGNQKYPFTIPEGTYFVLGDNRNDSSDSRYVDVGTVKKEDILGKTFVRIWPFSDFGFIKYE